MHVSTEEIYPATYFTIWNFNTVLNHSRCICDSVEYMLKSVKRLNLYTKSIAHLSTVFICNLLEVVLFTPQMFFGMVS